MALARGAVRQDSRNDSPRKIDIAGRPIRQIELCVRHAQIVVARERAHGLEILDHREMGSDGYWRKGPAMVDQ